METTLKINNINIFDYFVCDNNLKSSLSDYYVKNISCEILLAKNKDDKQVGLLIYQDRALNEILYLKGSNDSTKKELIHYLQNSTLKSIRYRIINNDEEEKMVKELGFINDSDMYIYQTLDKDHPKVKEFLQKYNKIYQLFLNRDYVIKTFEELNDDELNQIIKNPDNELASELNPAKFINGNFNTVSKKISTVVLKNNQVAAYTLLHDVGNKCIFEILVVAKSFRKTPVLIVAIMKSINALIDAGFTSFTFAAYKRNINMVSIYENNFKEYLKPKTIQHNMIYRGKYMEKEINKNKKELKDEELLKVAGGIPLDSPERIKGDKETKNKELK